MIFKELPIAKNCLRPASAPLTSSVVASILTSRENNQRNISNWHASLYGSTTKLFGFFETSNLYTKNIPLSKMSRIKTSCNLGRSSLQAVVLQFYQIFKKSLWHGCFSGVFTKFLEHLCYRRTLGDRFLLGSIVTLSIMPQLLVASQNII